MACTLSNGVRTPWNKERLYEKKISIQFNLDAGNGPAVSENDLFKNSVNTLSRFLTLFIACSDNMCFIYKPAYALPMLYKTVQFLSLVHVSATISPSPDYVKRKYGAVTAVTFICNMAKSASVPPHTLTTTSRNTGTDPLWTKANFRCFYAAANPTAVFQIDI